MATDQKVELFYFHARGLAEITRLTLTVAGIQYNETDMATREDYLALQNELLFGQLPLLRIDGLKLVQSGAIVRYVARKAGLLGSNNSETARIEMIYEGTRDFNSLFKMGWVPEDKAKADIVEKGFPRYLPVFNKLLGNNSNGFLVGDSLSLADLGLLEVLLAIVDYWNEEPLQSYPDVLKFYRRLSSNERVIDYVTNKRKPKTNDAMVASVKAILSHLFQ